MDSNTSPETTLLVFKKGKKKKPRAEKLKFSAATQRKRMEGRRKGMQFKVSQRSATVERESRGGKGGFRKSIRKPKVYKESTLWKEIQR